MFHCCGCSAFIINLADLIIDQKKCLKWGAGLLFLFSAGKFQVDRWVANAFGQGLFFLLRKCCTCHPNWRTNITFSIFDVCQLVFVNYSADCNLPLERRGSVRFPVLWHDLTSASWHRSSQLPGTVFKGGRFQSNQDAEKDRIYVRFTR